MGELAIVKAENGPVLGATQQTAQMRRLLRFEARVAQALVLHRPISFPAEKYAFFYDCSKSHENAKFSSRE